MRGSEIRGKNNPLFVDSTIFQGDSVTTQIHVFHRTELGDDLLSMTVTRRGEEIEIPLVKESGDDRWRGQALFEHLEPLEVKLIRHSGQETVVSSLQEMFALHVLEFAIPEELCVQASLDSIESLSEGSVEPEVAQHESAPEQRDYIPACDNEETIA